MEIWVLALGIPFLIIGLPVVAGLIESRLVWPYAKPEPECHVDDVVGYAKRAIGQATESGFEFLGWSRDLKGPMFKNLSYAILVSSDRKTIAIVGIGVLMNQRVGATWLTSIHGDRLRFVTSTDNPEGVEPDVSGVGTWSLDFGASFHELLQKHQSLLRAFNGNVYALKDSDAFTDTVKIRQERYDWLERRGIVRFVNPERTRWKYTLRGSLAVALKRQAMFFKAIPSMLRIMPRQAARAKKEG